MVFFEEIDWSTFWSAVGGIATVAGVIVAVWVAYEIHNLQLQKERQKNVADREERRESLRHALKSSIIANNVRLAEINQAIDKEVFFRNLDLSVLDSTAALKYEVLSNFSVCLEIDGLRDDLRHIYTQVHQLLRVDHDAMAREAYEVVGIVKKTLHQTMREGLVALIKSHIPAVQKRCVETVEFMELDPKVPKV